MKYALVCLSGKPRRFSGLLHSVAMEVSPGTFLAADFDRAAFERIWAVMAEWHQGWPEGWIAAVIPAGRSRHPPEIRCLGLPRRKLVEQDGLHLLWVERGTN